jgi:hypothetical protein
MWHPTKEWFETSSKILGLVGGAFTLAKTFFPWAVDQSLERKINKVTERIGESIHRIRRLEESKAHVESIDVHVYTSQLGENLKADLKRLQSALDKKQHREEKRNAVPKGPRTWLLFYWPEGFDGWLVHSLFYGCAALIVRVGALQGFKYFSSSDHLQLVGIYILILLYFRWAALRLKRVAILKRIRSLDRINDDLGLLRRTLLLFKPGSGWPLFIHIEYYFLVAVSLAMPVLFLSVGGPGAIYKPFYWEVSAILMTIFLLCARVLAADALAWRFLGTLSNTETSTPTTVSTAPTS